MNPALARLIAAQICLHACMTGIRLAAPLLALHAGHSGLAVGGLLALFALTQVFLALPAGRYADRHGLRKPVTISVGMAVLGAVLAAAFPVYPVLCASALLTGGATGIAVIALQRHVGRAAEGSTQLKQVFSWLALGPALSNFIGPFAAGLMIDHAGSVPADQWGFQAAFALMVVLPLATWALVQGVQELPPIHAVQGAAKPRVLDLLHDPMLRRLLLVNWFLSSCWDVHTFVVPILGHERGLSASTIGTILGGFAIAAAVVRMAMPMVAARLRGDCGRDVDDGRTVCAVSVVAQRGGDGRVFGVLGLGSGFGTAHDHEYSAPDHSRAPPRRGPGPAADEHQCVQCGDAAAVWRSQRLRGRGRTVLGGGGRGGRRL